MDINREECVQKEEATSCSQCCDMSPKVRRKEWTLGWHMVVSSMEVTGTIVWSWEDESWMQCDEERRGVRKYI